MTAVGIDLGTSNTVVAHFKDGKPYTLVDPAGRRLIPSIISFHPSGTVLVGDSAKMRRFNDGVSTVTGAKRLMGRLWGSAELEEMRKRVPYQLREGSNKTVRALLRGELYSIPELSAFVLRKAKAWAEEALKQKVTQAVITVPANFNELQRQATKLAGELAGLEVLRVLNEPTAAALAYGHIAPAARDEQISVYDFGGGTFDLTMLKMSERELRVRATAGDMFLGGDDIDLAIANKMAEAYLKQHRYDPRVDMEVFSRVRVAAERIKVELSGADEATIPLNELMYGPGGKPIQWSYSMRRKELDAILDPFITQSLKVCEDAMALLKASPREFDRVVLVGGTTLSPRVRERVSTFFGREPVAGLDPEEAGALGAAISSTMPVARKAKEAGAQKAAGGAKGPAAAAASPTRAGGGATAPASGVGPPPASFEELDIDPDPEPQVFPISMRPPAFAEPEVARGAGASAGQPAHASTPYEGAPTGAGKGAREEGRGGRRVAAAFVAVLVLGVAAAAYFELFRPVSPSPVPTPAPSAAPPPPPPAATPSAMEPAPPPSAATAPAPSASAPTPAAPAQAAASAPTAAASAPAASASAPAPAPSP